MILIVRIGPLDIGKFLRIDHTLTAASGVGRSGGAQRKTLSFTAICYSSKALSFSTYSIIFISSTPPAAVVWHCYASVAHPHLAHGSPPRL